MKYVWMQEFKSQNQIKSVLLMLGFPLLLLGVLIIVLAFVWVDETTDFSMALSNSLSLSWEIFWIVMLIVVLRGLISFYFQKDIMFSFSWAKAVTRKENPEIYNLVENLCISRGLPVPQIWIIEDSSLNAFATGRKINDSWIVFTRWLLNTLNKREIEAVAGHELTHLMNKDCQLMFIATVFGGVISLLGEILIRTWRSEKENKGILPLIWLVCLILGYLIYPLLRLAMSRKREFLADLWSVELTHDGDAMISALEKISGRSEVKGSNPQIAMFYIETPTESKKEKSSIFDTHPSIDERIDAIRTYCS